MDILYAVSEAFPFAKNGGLGDVAGSYPVYLRQAGMHVRGIMPLYDIIPQEFQEQMELVENFTLNLGLETLYCGLYQLTYRDVTWYFVENDVYFHRGALYGCADDDARFAFFSKAVCESIKRMGWVPDIIHCNDWQTALIPFYLQNDRLYHPEWKRIRTMFTIHNVEFQGDFSYHTLTDVFGLSGVLFSEGTVELDGSVNLMKGAIEIADCITTVSPSYAAELSAPDAVGPIAQVIASHEITGILNGLTEEANPFDSRLTHRPYSVESVEEKVFNKLWMQEMHGLNVSEDAPVFGCVSRLIPRKGFELLCQVLPEFLEQGAQLVVTGDGRAEIAQQLKDLRQRFPKQVALTAYTEGNAVEIFSSADIFLMPSQVEPCGTAQMQAMRYGTVPVVHLTGGLQDTVKPYSQDQTEGWGFGFTDYTAQGLRDTLKRALEVYWRTEEWETLERRCMTQDFSWDKPVAAYCKLYASMLKRENGGV